MPHKDPTKRKEYMDRYNKRRSHLTAKVSAEWRDKHRVHWEEYQRQYRSTNRIRINQRSKERRLRNPEKHREVCRRYSQEHKAELAEKKREYYKRNKVKVKRQRRAWYQKHREKVIRKNSAYLKRNPHVYLASCARRRARIKNTIQDQKVIQAFISSTLKRKVVKCYYCKRRLGRKSRQFDHIVPLSKGGSHTIDNLCVSCKACNCSKHSTLLSELDITGQQILAL